MEPREAPQTDLTVPGGERDFLRESRPVQGGYA